ncbi:tetra-peptide repeat homeobox protein 1-like [Corvus moneduloides]|uniref:tetra-peptide repeat homeobox protein 1-like n=1 Tax=Corvus moneduloides TaxID=1196302 RepID=UPI001363A4FF|nr:tetra-peptide repeat homeobox protein 1-like [Corvus moneduloides]
MSDGAGPLRVLHHPPPRVPRRAARAPGPRERRAGGDVTGSAPVPEGERLARELGARVPHPDPNPEPTLDPDPDPGPVPIPVRIPGPVSVPVRWRQQLNPPEDDGAHSGSRGAGSSP